MFDLIMNLLIITLLFILLIILLFYCIILLIANNTKCKVKHIIKKRRIDFVKITNLSLLKRLTIINEELMPTYNKLCKLKSKAKDKSVINDINNKIDIISNRINNLAVSIKKSQIKINNEKNDKNIKNELKQIDEVINNLK